MNYDEKLHPTPCDVRECNNFASWQVQAILNKDTSANFCTRHRVCYWATAKAFSNALSAFMAETEL
jgi:hypothetical protein